MLLHGALAVAQTDSSFDSERQAGSAGLPEAPAPLGGTALTVRNAPRNVLHDQVGIWTSPLRIRPHDVRWLAPLALVAGVAIATDHRAMTDVVSRDPVFNHASVDASNALLAGLVAAPVTLFVYGHMTEDERARESGFIGSEALVDAAVVEQGLKLVFWRERPHVDDARGRFFESGVGPDSSMPSSHTVFAWSSAAVLADEYPSPMVRIGIYSLATGVSLTRVLGQEHFPSDVLVGSAAGWLVGHYVDKIRHHREVR
jgi:membrane-associated phospholipid phosphatase